MGVIKSIRSGQGWEVSEYGARPAHFWRPLVYTGEHFLKELGKHTSHSFEWGDEEHVNQAQMSNKPFTRAALHYLRRSTYNF